VLYNFFLSKTILRRFFDRSKISTLGFIIMMLYKTCYLCNISHKEYPVILNIYYYSQQIFKNSLIRILIEAFRFFQKIKIRHLKTIVCIKKINEFFI